MTGLHTIVCSVLVKVCIVSNGQRLPESVRYLHAATTSEKHEQGELCSDYPLATILGLV